MQLLSPIPVVLEEREFAALRGKVSNIQEPGQSCRICLDSAIIIKVCELTCGHLHRELSVLQLNELVADLGKTKIKPGHVQAVSWSQEPEFQSTLALTEGEQEKTFLCMQRTFPEL